MKPLQKDRRASTEKPKRECFGGGGITGELIDSIDWSKSSLGPISSWPASLRTIVGTMLQSRHPMFLFWGPDLIQFYNDAYLPSFGVGKHPAAMGQRGADCWGEIWPIIWPQIDDVMNRSKASWNEDHLVPIFRNGRIEEVYWTYGYSPVRDDNGQVGGTLVVCTETTSRVVMERRFRVLRRLAEASAVSEDIDSITQRAMNVIAESQNDIPFALLYRATSESDEPALAASVNLDDASLAEVVPCVKRYFKEEAPKSAGVRHLSLPQGTVRHCAPWPEPPCDVFIVTPRTPRAGTFVFGISSRLRFDADYQRFLVDFVDQIDQVAARAEALRARTAMKAERRNLLLQAPVATAIVIGANHIFEFANPLYLEMVGRDVLGKNYVDAFPEIAGTPLLDILDRVYQTGEPFVAEEYLIQLSRQDDGRLEDVFFKFNLQPVRDEDCAVYGVMVMAADVTAQVNARRILERANTERQKLVAELEAANRAKDAFLATVSHELRTPLNAILGWARMLRAGSVAADKVDRGLEVIERNSLSQVQLIEDLLDVSRIISGKLRLDVQPIAVAPLVDAAVDSMQHALQAKGIQFARRIDPDVETIEADGHRLQQVIWNLLSNAVKFTPKGGTIRLLVQRTEGGIEFSVNDTGQGIPSHLLPSLFERFKQADGSAVRVHGGLGLGLAIARHIAELHGGTITAHSEGEGRGATFALRLPVSPSRRQSDWPFRHTGTMKVSPHFEHPKELQGLTVLVVDDEDDTRDLLVEVLHQLGASVLTAASAEQGLAVLDRASPRVLVCDIAMPGMDGYAFIEAVRKRPIEKGGRTVALALTAYAGAENRRKALRAGFQMHLAKPVEPAEFVSALADLAQLAIAMT